MIGLCVLGRNHSWKYCYYYFAVVFMQEIHVKGIFKFARVLSAVAPKSPCLLVHCHGGGFVAQSSRSHQVSYWSVYWCIVTVVALSLSHPVLIRSVYWYIVTVVALSLSHPALIRSVTGQFTGT